MMFCLLYTPSPLYPSSSVQDVNLARKQIDLIKFGGDFILIVFDLPFSLKFSHWKCCEISRLVFILVHEVYLSHCYKLAQTSTSLFEMEQKPHPLTTVPVGVWRAPIIISASFGDIILFTLRNRKQLWCCTDASSREAQPCLVLWFSEL